MITHVILDLDGTLYKKESVVQHVLQNLSREKNIDFEFVNERSIEAEKLIKQNPAKFESNQQFFTEAYKLMLPLIGLENSNENLKYIEDLVEEAKQKVLLDITPRKGVIELLTFLKQKNIKTIVFSGGHSIHTFIDPEIRNKNYKLDLEFKETQVKILGLGHLINEVIPTSMFNSYKPEKKVFERLLRHLECKANECIMIGNSQVDVAANQVGMKTIYLDDKKEEGAWVPDYKVSDFYEIKNIVSSIINYN